MFRGSCFEYAGTYSGDYNLTIMYVENSYNKFDTGGSYKPCYRYNSKSGRRFVIWLKTFRKSFEIFY